MLALFFVGSDPRTFRQIIVETRSTRLAFLSVRILGYAACPRVYICALTQPFFSLLFITHGKDYFSCRARHDAERF